MGTGGGNRFHLIDKKNDKTFCKSRLPRNPVVREGKQLDICITWALWEALSKGGAEAALT